MSETLLRLENENFKSVSYFDIDLWFEADRTRVLPVQHAEAVDRELAKRADQARKKIEKAAAKAAKSEA